MLTGLHPTALYIITEYCQGGDLLPLLENSAVPLGWKFRVKLALQASAAIHYLHDNNFIHRDVKSQNFLLDHNWVVKLTDFGMSRVVSDPSTLSRMTICGTNEYMAPEMLFQEEYCSGVDIFSLGLVFIEIMARRKVGFDGFVERKPKNNFEIDMDALAAQLPDDAPASLKLLANTCVEYEAATRPIGASLPCVVSYYSPECSLSFCCCCSSGGARLAVGAVQHLPRRHRPGSQDEADPGPFRRGTDPSCGSFHPRRQPEWQARQFPCLSSASAGVSRRGDCVAFSGASGLCSLRQASRGQLGASQWHAVQAQCHWIQKLEESALHSRTHQTLVDHWCVASR
jgi:serine/threonine protein kinase